MAVDKLELHSNRKTRKMNKIYFYYKHIFQFSHGYFTLLLLIPLSLKTREYNVRMQNVSIIGGDGICII
jgi:hypothetical protein